MSKLKIFLCTILVVSVIFQAQLEITPLLTLQESLHHCLNKFFLKHQLQITLWVLLLPRIWMNKSLLKMILGIRNPISKVKNQLISLCLKRRHCLLTIWAHSIRTRLMMMNQEKAQKMNKFNRKQLLSKLQSINIISSPCENRSKRWMSLKIKNLNKFNHQNS